MFIRLLESDSGADSDYLQTESGDSRVTEADTTVVAASIFDTFDGLSGLDLLSHVGQIGASWSRHMGGPADWVSTGFNNWFRLTGAGRAYSGVFSYRTVLYMASGVLIDSEYDIRLPFTSLSDPGGDNHSAVAFKCSPTTASFWSVGYRGFNKDWCLAKWSGGLLSVEGTYGDIQSSFPVTRVIEVRIRDTSPRIAVYIDGVQRITSDDTTTPGNRIGLLQVGGNPPAFDNGLQFDQIAAGPVGFTLPSYEVSGPIEGPPGFVSSNYTVSLFAGVNPGSITVTPSVTGLTGTFTPTTVTLTDAARSATFTFTPNTIGTATISFANNIGSPNNGSLTYNAAFLPPARIHNWEASWLKFHSTGTNPYVAGSTNPDGTGGYYLDGVDHYDPIWCFQQIQEYSIRNGLAVTDWSVQIAAGLKRFRDRAVLAETGRDAGGDSEGVGVIGYHRYLTGIMVDYFLTGDPKNVEAAGYLSPGDNPATFRVAEAHDDKYRETAFIAMTCIDFEVMGLGNHPLVDVACATTLDYHDSFLLSEAVRYGATYKPFMVGIGLMMLIRYWERYRTSTVPAKVANIARIPDSIKNMSQKLWDHDWFPAGVDAGNGWTHGAISYKSHALTDPNNQKIENLTITAVSNPRSVFRGPLTLSTVNDFYKGCKILLFLPDTTPIADSWMCSGYVGSTREFTINPTYPFQTDVTTSFKFSIWPASWSSLESDGDRGPSQDLNLMVAHGFAWSYWHTKVIQGNTAGAGHWRLKYLDVFNGTVGCWGFPYDVKQNNQQTIYAFKGLEYLYRGDSEWPVAANLTFQGPPAGLSVANRAKAGPFRLSIPYGNRVPDSEVVALSSSTNAGTFSPSPIVTNEMRVAMFSYQTADGDDDQNVTITANGPNVDPVSVLTLTVGSATEPGDPPYDPALDGTRPPVDETFIIDTPLFIYGPVGVIRLFIPYTGR